MEFQYGDVLLVHGNDLLSIIIQKLTGSYWSHTMIALEDGKFGQMAGFGFIWGKDSLSRPYAVLRHVDLINPYSNKAKQTITRMKAVVEKLKKSPPPFDYLKLFVLGFKLIGRRMTAVSVAEEKTPPLICSALIDYIYEKAGLDLRPGNSPYDTTPANLAELVMGEKPLFKVVHLEKTKQFLKSV